MVCFSYSTGKFSGARRTLDNEDWRQGIRNLLVSSNLLVGFNFKFDYHWFRKSGIDLSKFRIWDCQLAEYILSNQTIRFPSLEATLIKYGLGNKVDIVKTEYWDKGINTDDIPWPVLEEYATVDAVMTMKVYQHQLSIMTQAQKTLLSLMCQDLKILAEMEWNGLVYDEELCKTRSEEITHEIETITTYLKNIYPEIPINFNSPDHLSAFLYGGTITEEVREQIGIYKSGLKSGQPRFRLATVTHDLPRLCTPLRGTELKKAGLYSTDEATIKQLRGSKRLRDSLLRLAKLDKLNGTYYKGIPKLNREKCWPIGIIHGQFNQPVTVSGRLSSSAPNLQNFASDLQDIFITRYPEVENL